MLTLNERPTCLQKTYHTYPGMLLSWMLTMVEHWLVLLTFPWLEQTAVLPPPWLLLHISCCSSSVTLSWNKSSKSNVTASSTVLAKCFLRGQLARTLHTQLLLQKDTRVEANRWSVCMSSINRHALFQLLQCLHACSIIIKQQMAHTYFSVFIFSPFLT